VKRPDTTLLGVGIYTPAEAAHLTGIAAGKLVRWLKGHGTGNRHYPALWNKQITLDDDSTHLGFLDLVQAKMADAFIKEGLTPQKVRRAILLAQDIVDNDHPFATSRFRTDGKTLMLDALSQHEEDAPLIDLFKRGQYVMKRLIEPSLKDIEFDSDIAVRWWPLGRGAGIVIDPTRQFGRPIIAESGIPTSVLSAAVKAEGSVANAARAYSVSVAAVRKAVDFEEKMAA
jgi:uncharacterized protein (DUF433 family)